MEEREYLEQLTEQIRYKEARGFIAEEIRNHIEDQTKAYIIEGMASEEARKKAVEEMGDPVEVGILLNKVHRPKMEWQTLCMIGLFSMIGLILQYVLNNTEVSAHFFVNHLFSAVIGFGLMFSVYRINYTVLKRSNPYIYVGTYIAILVLCIMYLPAVDNRAVHRGLFYTISIVYLIMYVGILYRFKGKGYLGVFLGCIFLWCPVHLAWLSKSGGIVIQTIFAGSIILSFALIKGWYCVKIKRTLCFLWGIFITVPSAFIALVMIKGNGNILATYQVERIKAFFDPKKYEMSGGFQTMQIKNIMYQISLFSGMPEDAGEISGYLPNISENFVITSIFGRYGFWAGAVLIALCVWFLLHIYKVSVRQKHSFGSMLSITCTLIFSMQSIIYILCNIKGIIFAPVSMPFLSYGTVYTLVNYGLMGLLLSVHRNTEIIA